MRNKVIAATLLVALPICAAQWQLALPGYAYNFPKDHFNHPEYKTEWWYYTGNLNAADGHRFGFELTFFRQGVDVAAQEAGVWNPAQVYLAHLALSDIDGQQFYHKERLNRAGPGLAGVSLTQGEYWNGNWKVRWDGDRQALSAMCGEFALELDLKPLKPVVFHGKDGISQKGPQKGEASHYLSYTRLSANGQLALKGVPYKLSGLAWMDHEFFSQVADRTLAGWDWFAIQMENGEEVMLYRLRQKSGAADPFSSGSYIDAKGEVHRLDSADLQLWPSEEWQSPLSRARYPLAWRIQIPRFEIDLTAKTALKQQELFSNDGVSPSYWEGAMQFEGQAHAKPVKGVGYLEMTGYDKAFQIGH